MNYATRILFIAAPLVGCGGGSMDPPGDGSSSGGAGTSSSSTGPSVPTTGGTSGGDPSSGDTSSGDTSGDTSSGDTSSGDTSSTGSTSEGDDTSTGSDTGAVEPAPDFMLIDVNPNSATHEQPVSPRDYLEQVSGWYFAHAT